MAFVVKVPVSICSEGKFGAVTCGGRMKNGVHSARRTLVSASVSSSPAQNLELLSTKSKDIGLPIMVNSCTGKMGKAVSESAVKAGLHIVPVSFGAAEDSGKSVQVGGKEIEVRSQAESPAAPLPSPSPILRLRCSAATNRELQRQHLPALRTRLLHGPSCC